MLEMGSVELTMGSKYALNMAKGTWCVYKKYVERWGLGSIITFDSRFLSKGIAFLYI